MPPRRNAKRGVSEVPEITEPSEVFAVKDSSTELQPRWPGKPEEFKDHVDYSLMNLSAMQPLSKRELYPRQQRWKNDKKEPITDMKDVPEGWNADDLDIDQDDIDGQIERCLERIEDGIMPQIFELKLEMYEERKAARDAMIRSEPDGLSWDVVQRLDQLKIIQEHLNKEGDPDDQLPNVKSLIAAYREGKLEFKIGTVSYWTKGVQLNPPQEFNEDIHKAMSKENDTTKAWWVEGLLGPSPAGLGSLAYFGPYNLASANEYRIQLSPDIGVTNPFSYSLLATHDTGADLMAIPSRYIELMERTGYQFVVNGYQVFQIPGGLRCGKIVEVDVGMFGIGPTPNAGQGPWMRVQASVVEDLPGFWPGRLLSGPFLRFMCYTATCPDGQGNLYVSWQKRDLGHLPDLPPGFVPHPVPTVATYPPTPGGGPPVIPATVAGKTGLKRGRAGTPGSPQKRTRRAGP